MKYLSLALILCMTFISCGNRSTIPDLFKMEGCTGPCYQRMACEGKQVTLEIPLTGSNILQNGSMLFVRDENDPDKTIKIEYDQGIPKEIQDQVINNVGKTAVIKGHIEGYDLLNPQSCRRAHLIYVSRAEDISFE